jgi:hypothetical protein
LGAGAARAKRVEALSRHRSDTVRGWCAYALAGERGLALDESLSRMRVFAADAHFGVREFAWLAVRPALAAEIERGIALLTPWTREHDANLRRFASEATRPRGVWCAHIALLRREPQRGCRCSNRCAAMPRGTCATRWRTGSTTLRKISPRSCARCARAGSANHRRPRPSSS